MRALSNEITTYGSLTPLRFRHTDGLGKWSGTRELLIMNLPGRLAIAFHS